MSDTGTGATRRGLTLEQFLQLPETRPASEYRDGRVTRKMSPRGRHSLLQASWVRRLNELAEPERRGFAFPELRFTFAGRSLVPDVAFVSWERIPRAPSGEIADLFLEAPELAIQILSPRQAARDAAESLDFFVRNGSRLGLLVDPDRKHVTVFVAGQAPRTLSAGPLDLSPVLPGGISIEEVFGWLVLPR